MRFALFAFVITMAFAAASGQAAGIDPQDVTLATSAGPLAAKFFPAAGADRHPSAILLHGMHGIGPLRPFYEDHAVKLAEAGIDAYLFSYYRRGDADMAKATSAERDQAFRQNLGGWVALVDSAVDGVLASPRANGKIAVIGFSQGGFLATAVAGGDPRINALAVYYGGVPSSRTPERLPPVLELHGDADTNVSVAEGKALTDLAHRLGQEAEQVVFTGAGHGFRGAAADAAEVRLLAFLKARLTP